MEHIKLCLTSLVCTLIDFMNLSFKPCTHFVNTAYMLLQIEYYCF